MKKTSKQVRKGLINAFVIIGTMALVIYLAVRSGDIGKAWSTMRSCNPLWLCAAFCGWLVFALGEGYIMHVFFRQQKIKIRMRDSLLVGMIGNFYSAVTPAATGGQPMQVFCLKKRGIPTGISSSALTVKFFCYQMALLIFAGVMWALNGSFVAPYMNEARWFVIIGFLVNGATVAIVLLLAINQNIVRALIVIIIRLGHKLHLCKDVAAASSKTDAAMLDYHNSVDMLVHHPFGMLRLLLLSFIQILGHVSVIYCIYRALGLEGTSYGQIITLQLLLSVGASFTPLPGASGAQEGGFYLLFLGVFTGEGVVLGALLLWRFFTYYITLLFGMGTVIFDSTRRKKEILSAHPTVSEIEQQIKGEGAAADDAQAPEAPSAAEPPCTTESEKTPKEEHAPTDAEGQPL